MKIHLVVLVLASLCLCGCQKQTARPTHVFSVAVFKPMAAKAPSASELVALKAFALSAYNPYSTPKAINDDELAKVGFSLMMTANQEVSMDEPLKEVCSQGLAWGSDPKRLQIVVKPVQGGVEVYGDSGPGGASIKPTRDYFVGVGSIGTHVFDDGLVIAWVVKPIAGKN